MGMNVKKNKGIGFIIILLCYIVATWIGVEAYQNLTGVLWFKLLIADVAATLSIWALSLVLQNASLYDPYWSVQPMVILILLLIKNGTYDFGSLLLCSVILFWGIRLTANWAYTFEGLSSQDWRYDQLKNQTGRLYQLVNLVGIQMMPTFIVFLCILPAVYYMEFGNVFSYRSLIGLMISISGALLQMIADLQMQSFRKNNADKTRIIREGLWKYSRHPNYLGEILMWWGIYLTFIVVHVDKWLFGIGAFINTLLFLFISIPMAEKHLAGYKEGYEDYCKETRKLLPFPKYSLILKHGD